MPAAPLHRPSPAMAAVLLLAALVAYANAFGGAFQFDDFNVIGRESTVQSLSAWWGAQPGIRPLRKLAYCLNPATGWGRAVSRPAARATHLPHALVWCVRGQPPLAGRT